MDRCRTISFTHWHSFLSISIDRQLTQMYVFLSNFPQKFPFSFSALFSLSSRVPCNICTFYLAAIIIALALSSFLLSLHLAERRKRENLFLFLSIHLSYCTLAIAFFFFSFFFLSSLSSVISLSLFFHIYI